MSLPNLRNGSGTRGGRPENALAGSAVTRGVRVQARQFPKVIFVVDDDPDMLRSLGRLLKAHGFETRVFPSAEAFLAQADQADATCLILDIQLGGASGIELRRELSRSGSLVPVVFITANDNEATERAAIEAGCVAFLSKPFTARALLDAVGKAHGGRVDARG